MKTVTTAAEGLRIAVYRLAIASGADPKDLVDALADVVGETWAAMDRDQAVPFDDRAKAFVDRARVAGIEFRLGNKQTIIIPRGFTVGG